MVVAGVPEDFGTTYCDRIAVHVRIARRNTCDRSQQHRGHRRADHAALLLESRSKHVITIASAFMIRKTARPAPIANAFADEIALIARDGSVHATSGFRRLVDLHRLESYGLRLILREDAWTARPSSTSGTS